MPMYMRVAREVDPYGEEIHVQITVGVDVLGDPRKTNTCGGDITTYKCFHCFMPVGIGIMVAFTHCDLVPNSS